MVVGWKPTDIFSRILCHLYQNEAYTSVEMFITYHTITFTCKVKMIHHAEIFEAVAILIRPI
jgi:hypothetical protein